MQSLTRQLQTYLALALSLAALLLFSLSYYLLDKTFRESIIQDLLADSDALAAALIRQDTSVALAGEKTPSYFQQPYSGHYFVIATSEETWRSRSLWDFSIDTSQTPNAELIAGPRQQKILAIKKKYHRFNQDFTIWVGQDYSRVLSRLNNIAAYAGIGFLLFLFLLLGLHEIIIRKTLSPIRELTRDIDLLQQGRKTSLNAEVPTELKPLALEINRLLTNTESTLVRSRAHLSNLGHALKTPLAVLISQTRSSELAAFPAIQKSLQENVTQIQNRIQRELAKARLAGDVLPAAYFTPALELPDLVATMKMIHGSHLNISWRSPQELILAIDREDALELVGNLLDNACKWANQNVEVLFEENPDYLTLKVIDDGPGIDPINFELAQSRGKRLDESVAGHGLGLTIVNDICHHFDASLSFHPSKRGGLCARIDFPLIIRHQHD